MNNDKLVTPWRCTKCGIELPPRDCPKCNPTAPDPLREAVSEVIRAKNQMAAAATVGHGMFKDSIPTIVVIQEDYGTLIKAINAMHVNAYPVNQAALRGEKGVNE
jgi:hypothetical protein